MPPKKLGAESPLSLTAASLRRSRTIHVCTDHNAKLAYSSNSLIFIFTCPIKISVQATISVFYFFIFFLIDNKLNTIKGGFNIVLVCQSLILTKKNGR